MNALLDTIVYILSIVQWFVIINIVMSWLVAFDVINLRNQFVYNIYQFLNAIVDPLLRPFRNILPNTGGIDLSPILLFVAIFFLQRLVDVDIRGLVLGR